MRFKYWKDPLVLACCVLYFVNRWWLKTLWPGGFCHEHLNDLICLPLFVPLMLWGMRRLRLRSHDDPPAGFEVLVPLVVWAAVFELLLPRMEWFRPPAIADCMDVFYYALGGLGGVVFWGLYYRPARTGPRDSEP